MGPLLQSTRSVVLCVRTTTAYKQVPLLIQLPSPASLYFHCHLPPTLLSSAFCPFQSFKIGITLPSLRCIPLCLDTPPGRLKDGKAMCRTESGGEDALQDGCTNALRGKISEGRGLPNWFAIGDINQGQLTTTTESGCKGLS